MQSRWFMTVSDSLVSIYPNYSDTAYCISVSPGENKTVFQDWLNLVKKVIALNQKSLFIS